MEPFHVMSICNLMEMLLVALNSCTQRQQSLTLMGNMVMLSGLSMLYQMQRFPLFWATTTSLPGTHWT